VALEAHQKQKTPLAGGAELVSLGLLACGKHATLNKFSTLAVELQIGEKGRPPKRGALNLGTSSLRTVGGEGANVGRRLRISYEFIGSIAQERDDLLSRHKSISCRSNCNKIAELASAISCAASVSSSLTRDSIAPGT
jgi:hypothetical protein